MAHPRLFFEKYVPYDFTYIDEVLAGEKPKIDSDPVYDTSSPQNAAAHFTARETYMDRRHAALKIYRQAIAEAFTEYDTRRDHIGNPPAGFGRPLPGDPSINFI